MNTLLQSGQMVQHLAQTTNRGKAVLTDLPGLLRLIIEREMWREQVLPYNGETVTFERFADFLASRQLGGLDCDPETLRLLCAADPEALALLDQALNGGAR